MAENYQAYVKQHANAIIADIKRLVDIKSVKQDAAAGMPYGGGVRAAQLEAMRMCERAGLRVTDCDGHIAYAHYGNTERFIAIAAHLDVVPAGDGWDSDPFDMTVRDGYLVGRGTGDDKGPFVLALYAIKYLMEHSIKLNYGIRLIIGLDEESGMEDIRYYKEHCAQPVFAFTPDAAFPVGHGEKGIFEANLLSPFLNNGVILEINGGTASNVVPDSATAYLKPETRQALTQAAQPRSDMDVGIHGDLVKVCARGIARHAGEPQGGINANAVLLRFLLDSGVLADEEKSAAGFLCEVLDSVDGSRLGIACDDGKFSPLTIIGGILSQQNGRLVLNVNCRYPTAITPQALEQKMISACTQNGFTVAPVMNSAPYYLDASYPAVTLLCNIYNEVTSSAEKPYVMSGGTYARHMENAVSYGIEPPQPNDPDWVGTAHMKNEAISIRQALEACEIFIDTLVRLQQLDL